MSDFGSEVVEEEHDFVVEPLPVDMVEEQGVASLEEPSSDSEQADEALANIKAVSSARAKSDSELDELGLPEDEASESTSFLNVKDMDIAALVKLISKQTKRNYILDSSVKGKVTVLQETPVTLAEALRIFDSVLLLKGFTTVPVGDNIWKVIQAKDAKQTTIPIVYDGGTNPSDTLVTHLMRLKHTQASDLQQLLSQFVSKEGLMSSFAGTNALIMIDSGANIKRLSKLVSELDVPAIDQDITIIPVLHAEAPDLADKIKEILGEDEKKSTASNLRTVQSGIRRPITPRTQTAKAASSNVGERTLPLKIISDERTNSLIVVADPENTAKVKALVERLDSPLDRSGGRFYVYRLKHADAEELGGILEQVISGAKNEDSSKTSGTQGSSITRSQNSTAESTSAVSQTSASTRARLSSALLRRGLGGEDKGRVSLEGEVFIAPDPATNSLIINASRADYLRLKEVIEALDVKRRQVLVEATILEVRLSKEEGMGIELQGTAGNDNGGIIGQTNFGSLSNLLSNPAALSDLSIAAASSGTLTLPGGLVIPSQAALLKAVSRNSNINVLSTPTIVATDNEEAEIIVGENVPFVTSTSTDTSNINNTFNQIERQDVGITLRITPQISTGDFIMLKIFVEISNVVTGTRNDPNGPTTTIRTTDTSVEVKHRQMIITGGLISDSITESTRGVPFFEDIPMIGNYFKRQDLERRRTNLLIFITPRIVTNQYDARETTRDYTEGMEQTMVEQQIEYPRTEVLRSPEIDNVVEELSPAEVLPTMVTPPEISNGGVEAQAAWERTQSRLQQLIVAKKEASKPTEPEQVKKPGPTLPEVEEEEEEVIEISVSPELPGLKGDAPATEVPQEESKVPPPSAAGVRTFVVLKDVSETGLPSSRETGYQYADENGTIGLVLIGPLASPATKFFAVGGRYRLKRDSVMRDFVCLGRYASAEEANIMHPEISNDKNWNSLSLQQTLSLGSNEWTAG